MDNASSNWLAFKQTMVVPSTLCSAAKANDVSELARLLASGAHIDAGATPDTRNHAGLTALDFASQFGRTEVAALLSPTRRSEAPEGV